MILLRPRNASAYLSNNGWGANKGAGFGVRQTWAPDPALPFP